MVDCNYICLETNDLIVIVDLNLGNRSVTNDIEAVLTELQKTMSLSDKQIFYRDSDKAYARVLIRSECLFDGFEPVPQKIAMHDFAFVAEMLKRREEIE